MGITGERVGGVNPSTTPLLGLVGHWAPWVHGDNRGPRGPRPGWAWVDNRRQFGIPDHRSHGKHRSKRDRHVWQVHDHSMTDFCDLCSE